MNKLRNKHPVHILCFLLAGILAISPAQIAKSSAQDYLAPKSALIGEVYSPVIQFVHPTLIAKRTEAPTQDTTAWMEEVFVGFKELRFTFDPVQFLALHDNRTKDGKVDWIKLSSRIVGVGLIYVSMIAGPYLLGELLIPQSHFLLSLLLYISIIASFPLFNAEGHDTYNLVAKPLKLGLLNIKFPPLASDEIACSKKGLSIIFVGERTKLAKRVNERLDQEAKDRSEFILNGVSYFKRKSGVHNVWAFKEDDKEKVANEFNFVSRSEAPIPKLSSDEIVCSAPGLNKIFFGRSSDLAKRINEKLNQSANDRSQFTLNSISYFKRKSGTRIVWAFKEEDKEKVANEFGFKLRSETPIPELSSDEIAIVSPGSKLLFISFHVSFHLSLVASKNQYFFPLVFLTCQLLFNDFVHCFVFWGVTLFTDITWIVHNLP